MIPFNKPYLSGKELFYIAKAVESGSTSGNSHYTKMVHNFFNSNFNFKKSLLTTSCTDALEMSAILANIKPGDEVIIPSYTFVSTANAFMLRGASIKFAESCDSNPNVDVNSIASLITSKTKVIVVVHYAGVACNMDPIQKLCIDNDILLVEDAAQAICSKYKGQFLGSIGDLSSFSFHETKNIVCGEGGLLAINNPQFEKRAEIIWEKGTNRSSFFRGEVDKYGWVDLGSSFLLSDILAAYLYAQLENLDDIQTKRISIWNYYNDNLAQLSLDYNIELPEIPDYATVNGHLYYIVVENETVRKKLLKYLKEKGIHAVFHYLSLHKSPFFKDKYKGDSLNNVEKFSDRLVRLPLFYELEENQQEYIISEIKNFYDKEY